MKRDPVSVREAFDAMAQEQRDEYLDHMRRVVEAHERNFAVQTETAAYVTDARRKALALPIPRHKCPGCFSAIYDGAAEQGWCCDCFPRRAEYEASCISGGSPK